MLGDRPALIEIASREVALDRLARRLHETMERLDPTDDPAWDAMPELNKEFYRQCIKSIVYELVALTAEVPATTT